MIPALKIHLDIFDIKALSVQELFAANTKQLKYKAEMAEFWNSFEQPLDAMICAVNPSAGMLPVLAPGTTRQLSIIC